MILAEICSNNLGALLRIRRPELSDQYETQVFRCPADGLVRVRLGSRMSADNNHNPESMHKKQLDRGFPFLRFAPQLEADFRESHLLSIRKRLIACMLVSMSFSVWAAIAHRSGAEGAVAATTTNETIEALRIWFMRPVSLFLLISPFILSLYKLTWLRTTPVILAALGSIGGFSIASMVAGGNAHAFVAMIAGFMACYLLMGLLFWEIALTGLVIVTSYLLSLNYHGVPEALIRYEMTILFVMTVMALVFHYGSEYGLRTAFLQRNILQDIGRHDGLTGLKNRRAFDEALQALWQQGLRDKQPIGLLLLDVDHFKAYNDHYGHQAGDRCLKAIADVIRQSERRPLDIAARIGGEEFALLLYGATADHVNAVGEQLLASVRQLALPHAQSGTADIVTVSAGAAQVTPLIGRSSASLQQFVDEALYAAKHKGRNCLVWQDTGYDKVVTGAFQLRGNA